MRKWLAELVKQNLRKGRNVQYNGKILSQCINSSDSSFSSFLSAPKKKEFRWEASSLEVESARYSKTTNYHASFLRHIHPSSKHLRTLLCTRQFSAGHRTGQCHVSRVVLSMAMHIQMHPIEKKHKPTKQTKKITPFSSLRIFSTNHFNSNTPAIIHYIIAIKKLSAFALGKQGGKKMGEIPYFLSWTFLSSVLLMSLLDAHLPYWILVHVRALSSAD